eukprot:756746-Hanusia_phi.AAC.2
MLVKLRRLSVSRSMTGSSSWEGTDSSPSSFRGSSPASTPTRQAGCPSVSPSSPFSSSPPPSPPPLTCCAPPGIVPAGTGNGLVKSLLSTAGEQHDPVTAMLAILRCRVSLGGARRREEA